MSNLIRACCAAVALATVAGCRPPAEIPGVPLYPNGQTAPLPRGQLAQIFGPLARIDDHDVAGQGGPFDLLPGCHFVALERRMTADSYAQANGVYWSGQFPPTIYAIRMKAGARYIIRRNIYSDGLTGRVVLTAREEDAAGSGTDLEPAKSEADLKACKEWEASTLRH